MSTSWHCLLCYRTDVPHSKRPDLCEDCAAALPARGLGWCSRCKRRKDAAAMMRRGYHCKACEAARNRTRYAAEAEARKAAVRARYAADVDAQRARNRAYRLAHREQINASRRQRYAADPVYRAHRRAVVRRTADPERARLRAARWRQANPERFRLAVKRWKLRAVLETWARR